MGSLSPQIALRKPHKWNGRCMKFCGRSRLTYLGQSVLAANGTTPQIVFCRHTPLIWCLKFTLARQLPGICLSCVGATRVSVANSFHPSVLTGLCHLSFYQELSVRHWHLHNRILDLHIEDPKKEISSTRESDLLPPEVTDNSKENQALCGRSSQMCYRCSLQESNTL